MPIKVKISGVDQVLQGLRQQAIKQLGQETTKTRRDVTVGYRAPYAIFVHENLEMKLRGLPRRSGIGVYWGTPGGSRGQSKYLEYPARFFQPQMTNIALRSMKRGRNFLEAVYEAGVFLLKESKKMVPVEHGTLRESGFVEIKR
jgi:hypothetical protein